MRRSYIAGNWKMNMTASEGVVLAKELVAAAAGCTAKVLIAPPFTTIPAVREVVKGTNIRIGAQNMSDSESGAHTGEISVLMLKDLGLDAVILGHSERRMIYGEKDAFINRKVKLALAHDLEVILCVGETLEEREAGTVEEVVKTQLVGGLEGLSKEDMKQVVIAYEPVWAIGTGKTATPEDADNVHAYIRAEIEKLFDKEAADDVIIQYGGSVKPGNVKELMAKENIDGALVGGASLKSELFIPIVTYDL
ncbi:MAG: triose-phosphate isomerase [Spirochaetia bacterium]|nr:triose-phosphate isomerase [Spirochaetia bacterium]MCF7940209.1 triose-phosphate isomerase [Spirochaetia bacterium]